MLSAQEQDALLGTIAAALEADGVLLIREADARGGWRFGCVRLGNAAKALAFGHWRQRFCYRTADSWLACCAKHGLDGRLEPMGAGTPFANVLIRVSKVRVGTQEPAPATIRQPVPVL